MMYAHTVRYPIHEGEFGAPEGPTCPKCKAGVNVQKVEFYANIRIASCLICGHTVRCRVIMHDTIPKFRNQRAIKEQDCECCGAVFKTYKERYCEECKDPYVRELRRNERLMKEERDQSPT